MRLAASSSRRGPIPKHLARWWGPHHFTNPVCEVDARPGGSLLIHMAGPDGTVHPMKGVFQEVVEPERLAFVHYVFEDAQGNLGLEVLNTITFAEKDGKTELTVEVVVLKAVPEVFGALAGMEMGWTQSLERLETELAVRRPEPSEHDQGPVPFGSLAGVITAIDSPGTGPRRFMGMDQVSVGDVPYLVMGSGKSREGQRQPAPSGQ